MRLACALSSLCLQASVDYQHPCMFRLSPPREARASEKALVSGILGPPTGPSREAAASHPLDLRSALCCLDAASPAQEPIA